MSASTFVDRVRPRGGAHPEPRAQEPRSESPSRDGWIGVDLAPFATAPSSGTFVPLLVLALVVALGVASLRIDLIRTRYAVAETLAAEQALIEEQRTLIVRKRELRDPAVLATLARERGFRAVGATHTLVDPMPPARGAEHGLPSVSAGPAESGQRAATFDAAHETAAR